MFNFRSNYTKDSKMVFDAALSALKGKDQGLSGAIQGKE